MEYLRNEPLVVGILDSDSWKIDLMVKRWSSSPDPTIEAKMYFKVTVS